MSSVPQNLLGDISSFDQNKMKKTADKTADKSGPMAADKLMASISGGTGISKLKHRAEPNVKTWQPTKEDIEEDRKQNS